MAKVYQATGKRKGSIAKVTLTSGSGKITEQWQMYNIEELDVENLL